MQWMQSFLLLIGPYIYISSLGYSFSRLGTLRYPLASVMTITNIYFCSHNLFFIVPNEVGTCTVAVKKTLPFTYRTVQFVLRATTVPLRSVLGMERVCTDCYNRFLFMHVHWADQPTTCTRTAHTWNLIIVLVKTARQLVFLWSSWMCGS